jgi:hypothetical protein
MNKANSTRQTGPSIRRTLCTCGALAALAAALVPLTGCSDDEISKEFRSAAFGSIETGVKSIIDGVVTGVFTVATPSTDASGTTTTTGG